jgi:hypothetical protein
MQIAFDGVEFVAFWLSRAVRFLLVAGDGTYYNRAESCGERASCRYDVSRHWPFQNTTLLKKPSFCDLNMHGGEKKRSRRRPPC